MKRLLLAFLLVLSLGGGAYAAEPPSLPQRFYLVGGIDPEIVPFVLEWLAETKNPELIINSPGGHMNASLQIVNAIKAKGNVKCFVRGLAASGAFAILQACKDRVMTIKSRLATHEPRVGIEGFLDRTAAASILLQLEFSSHTWNATCRGRLKLTPHQYEEKVRGKDWVMTWQEALAVGAVDAVLVSP